MNEVSASDREHSGIAIPTLALAIGSALIFSKMAGTYRTVLEKTVFPGFARQIQTDSNFKGARNKLRTQVSHDCLLVIWKESEFVPAFVLETMEIKKSFAGTDVTKNGLSTLYCRQSGLSDPAEIAAMRTDVDRICNAAECFGLIEFLEKKANKRPLVGTKLLHDVMMHVHIENARWIEAVANGLSSDAREAI